VISLLQPRFGLPTESNYLLIDSALHC